MLGPGPGSVVVLRFTGIIFHRVSISLSEDGRSLLPPREEKAVLCTRHPSQCLVLLKLQVERLGYFARNRSESESCFEEPAEFFEARILLK
jgi:hypothetical protein